MTGKNGLCAPLLSDLIGAIYDCALDPGQWLATGQRIAARCESSAGGICFHDQGRMHNVQPFVFGYSPGLLDMLGRHYPDSPMAVADAVSDIGDVNALSMDRQQLLASRFYQEVLEPFDIRDLIWFPALRAGGRMACMHASRTGEASRYQLRDVSLFKVLAPHVCRALAMSDVLGTRVLRSEQLERTLDALAAGIFLIARDGRVIYMNRAAERQVRHGKALRVVDNRLHPADPAVRAALLSAIDQPTQMDGAGNSGAVHSMAIPDGAGGGYVATLLPVESGRRGGVLMPFAASVAVFTQDPDEVPPVPGEAFALLHGLTGAELRVLLALSQGLGGREVADMLGVGEPTIRSHLQRMFSKTGTSRQADLLRLLQHATPPIGTGGSSACH